MGIQRETAEEPERTGKMEQYIIGIDSGDHRSFFYFLAGVDIDFGQGTRQTEGQYTEIPGCYGSGILMVESA